MITDTIVDLHQRGFTSDFILIDNRLFCKQMLRFFEGNEFEISEVHSFDSGYAGNEQIVVYAIECLNKARGTLFQYPGCFSREKIIFTKLRKFWR